MTHPFIGTWRAEANPRAFLTFTADNKVQGSDGINRIVSSWDENGAITSASSAASAGTNDGSTAMIRPAMSTLMAAPNMQTWVTGARSVEADGDELIVFDGEGREVGRLHRADETASE